MNAADVYTLSLPELWEYAVGILLPLLIALVTQRNWPGWAKSLTMLVFVLGTTTVGDIISGKLSQPEGWRGWLFSVLVVFVLAVTSYRHIWKQFGVTQKIEEATSYAPKRAAVEE